MCSKAPKPDPAIGQAATSNAKLAKEQMAVAREQLQWEKDRAAQQDPMIQRIVDQQTSIGESNKARSDEQWNIYKNLFQPVEARMVDDANNWDSAERKAQMAAEAGADVTRSYQAGQDQNERQMQRMGINPNSGRYAAINGQADISEAKDSAGAMNAARRATEQQGIALRTGVAQFGRNMPNTGIAADSAALNAGNSATGNINAGNAAHNAGLGAAANWFGGAQAGNSSAGNMMLGQYQGQLQAHQQNQDAMAGWGQLLGTAGSTAAMMKMRKGGLIKHNSVLRKPPQGFGMRGLSSLRRKGYAEGGMISGPGTGTSDSIPGTIEGVQPIRVSNGEAVLNKEAVGLVGEDFIHRINAGGLSMLNNGENQ